MQIILWPRSIEKENDDEEDNEGQSSRPSRYSGPRKQLTWKRLVHDIDSSLYENIFQNITYVNRDGNFEELTGYSGSKKDKNIKKLIFAIEQPTLTGRQIRCDAISTRTSYLIPILMHQKLNMWKMVFNSILIIKS